MKGIIAAFKSRRNAITYAQAMQNAGVRVRVISTPSRVGSSCGLSVLFTEGAFSLAGRILSMGDYSGFLGFYRV